MRKNLVLVRNSALREEFNFNFNVQNLINLKALKNLLKNLIDTIQNFKNTDNPFFDSIIHGVMFRISKGKVLKKNKTENALRKDFYVELLEMKDDIELDKTLFGFFNRCY